MWTIADIPTTLAIMQQDAGPKIGPKLELAEVKLGEDVSAWVLRHRNDDRSWRWISGRLGELTGVAVTGEHLRQIYAEHADTGAA
jgi:hypothetical protein